VDDHGEAMKDDLKAERERALAMLLNGDTLRLTEHFAMHVAMDSPTVKRGGIEYGGRFRVIYDDQASATDASPTGALSRGHAEIVRRFLDEIATWDDSARDEAFQRIVLRFCFYCGRAFSGADDRCSCRNDE
jgi:hypothetical protein